MPTTVRSAQTQEPTPEQAAQQARGEQWRKQIRAAVIDLLEAKGSGGLSMQAIAAHAGVSVGLIYKQFGSKEALIRDVIVAVLRDLEARVPAAMDAAGDDALERSAAGFGEYCRVIHDHRQAALVTYRESRYLSPESRQLIKDLEVQVGLPLHRALTEARDEGLLPGIDPELMGSNMAMIAHAWALKQWYFEARFTHEQYIRAQTDQLLRQAIAPEIAARYAHLFQG